MPRTCPDCDERYWEKCQCGYDPEMEEADV